MKLSAHFFLPDGLSDEEKTSIVNAVVDHRALGLIKARTPSSAMKRSFCLFWLWI
jgi:hypothetical protein